MSGWSWLAAVAALLAILCVAQEDTGSPGALQQPIPLENIDENGWPNNKPEINATNVSINSECNLIVDARV